MNGHALARKDLRPIIDRSESHPVNEAIFRSILGREWKRADRSETTFLLLLVAISEDSSPAILRDVVGSLSATKRRTDLLGWYQQGRVVGLILPDAGSHRAARRAIEKRLRGELDPRTLARVSITLHAYPAPLDNGSGVSGIDTLLTALRSDRLRPMTTFAKRALDIVGSAALLIALSPLLLAIAAIVKMTSAGPVLFRQTRIGGEGRPFTMLKFRTMFANADQALHRAYVSSFINGNGAKHGEGSNSVFKLAHDPRITPIGRLLRKTSLDEVPQFINVLRGEMSLVGPRPPLPYEVEQYKPWHRRRVLDAKPGITGLWQVTGRSRTTFDEMVRLDLRYARTPSIWTDIKILLATPRAVVSGKGAC